MKTCADQVPRKLSREVFDARVNILGVGVNPVNLQEATQLLERWREIGRREYVCCTSVHGLVQAQREPAIRSALNQAGLTTEDGMPLVWWCRAAGYSTARRVCGSDLLVKMCELGIPRGYRHFFYGGTPLVIERLKAQLTQRFPGLVVAGYRSPPFRALTPEEDAADIVAINEARPDFVWVGLGMPKQERWMAQHVGKIASTALIGIGAAFDFLSETKPRAPLWLQRSGFEWLFRFVTEPRRLARRYVIDNSIFVLLATQQLSGLRSYREDW
jgi:N-acetylglucosaminyldiphosphoundecaprenol N-acetyl-beta-D-mannosaminyltransferase